MAANKEVLKRLAKTINHHRIETSLCIEQMNMRDTCSPDKLCVDMVLVAQGTCPSFDSFEFDDDDVP